MGERQDEGHGKALHAGTRAIKEGLTEKVACEQSPEGGKGRKPGGDGDKNVSERRDSGVKGSDGLGALYLIRVAGAERAEARSDQS